MKTPGRKRVVGNNSTNHSTPSIHQATAKKDPLATLLFPSAPSLTDKENDLASPPRRGTTSKKMLSPASTSTKTSGIPLSPMRIGSSRPVPSTTRTQQQQSAPLRAPTPVTSPAAVIARDFAHPPAKTLTQLQQEIDHDVAGDLSNVMEEDEEEEEEEPRAVVEEIKPVETPAQTLEEVSALATEEEEKAELSIIGEEEEEEEEDEEDGEEEEVTEEMPQSRVEKVDPANLKPLAETASFVVPETQASADSPARQKIAVVPASLPVPVLSPQSRSVSGASSVAPDADDDETVPLNDGPSTLRTISSDYTLSSSLPASATARTPGGSNSRFAAVGSYSAAKIGMGSLNIGSSPPTATTSTFSGPSHNFRISSGGTQQLNFVGLPKKSMGLGLGRNWANANSSASDSQGSSSQGRQSFATAAGSISIETSNSGSTTATGAIKRKSLSGTDTSSKVAKVSRGSEIGGEQPRSKIEQLQSRIQNLHARSSVAAGPHRMSNAATFNTSNLFPTTSKPLSGSTSSVFVTQQQQQPQAAISTAKPVPVVPVATSTSTAAVVNAEATTAAPSNGTVRRPSVMERVKSFEHSSSISDHLNPPSPSKIPSAFNRSVSPVPPHSPRGLASPTFAPSSPRPITRSATSGLPLSTFGSPKLATSTSFSPMMGSPKPIPSSFFRSPPVVSSIPSLPSTAFRVPPAPIPAPASLPLAAATPPRQNPITRTTTPPGSPPLVDSFQSIFQRLAPKEQIKEKVSVVVEKKEKKKESIVIISDDEEEAEEEGEEDDYGHEEEEEDEEEQPMLRAVKGSTSSIEQERAERAEMKAIAERAREIDEQEEAEIEASKKRLPSLPEPQLLTKDDSEDEEDEEEDEEVDEERTKPVKEKTIVKKATKEDLRIRTSPSKIVMPGTFGAQLVAAASSNQNSPHESEVEDMEEEDGDDERDEDRTTMSMMSTATGTFNFTQPQGAFRVSYSSA